MNLSIYSQNGELVTILINNNGIKSQDDTDNNKYIQKSLGIKEEIQEEIKSEVQEKRPKNTFQKKLENKRVFISLRVMLLITYLLIGFIPVLFVSNNIMNSMEDYFIDERKAIILSNANMVAGQVSSYSYLEKNTNKDEVEAIISRLGESSGFRILIFNNSSQIVYDTGYENIGQTFLIKEVMTALGGKDVSAQYEKELYVSVSILNDEGLPVGAVFIADDISNIFDKVIDISQKGNQLSFTVLLIVAIITFLITRIFTDPLKNMILVIQEMSEGHFSERVSTNFPFDNEVVDLAVACNNMAEKLDKTESIRSNFVLNVSHELKTPLSGIKILAESLLYNNNLTYEENEFLGDINSEVDRINDIIDKLLILVKSDKKEAELNYEETDLNISMENLIKVLVPLALKQRVNLEYFNEKNSEVLCCIDEEKISLAITNIIDNAIKYTPSNGFVTITLEVDHNNAYVTVADTGIGIPENEINMIFERFYRVDKTRDRKTGGVGLGLAITYNNILMHKGSIKVKSVMGEGTIMKIKIPLAPAHLNGDRNNKGFNF